MIVKNELKKIKNIIKYIIHIFMLLINKYFLNQFFITNFKHIVYIIILIIQFLHLLL